MQNMQKQISRFLLLGLLTFGIFSCKDKKDDPTPNKTPEELAIEELTGGSSQIWTIAGGGTVIRDGRSETNIYQTFELTLAANSSSKTYTTINSNDLFDANGNWSFVAGGLDKILLTGSKPVANNQISWTRTGNDLILRFSIVAPGARQLGTAAVLGNYVFTLKKKA
jgi:hypothetical protein